MTRKSKWILIVSIFVFVVDLLWYSIYFCGGGVFFLIAGIVLIFVSGWFNRKKDVCKGKHYAIAKHFDDNAIHYLLK